MICDKCGSNKIVPYMPITGWECKKCGDKDCNKSQKLETVLSSSTDLLSAARLLVERLDLVHDDPAYKGIWQMAAVHGMNYNGPTYNDELETLKVVLAGT